MVYEGAEECVPLERFSNFFDLAFLVEVWGVTMATLGERDEMTTAIPSVGVIALIEFLRPLGLDGVAKRGVVGIGVLGSPAENLSIGCFFPFGDDFSTFSPCTGFAFAVGGTSSTFSSPNGFTFAVEGVSRIEGVLVFFGIPLSGRTCLFFVPGGRPLRFDTLVPGVLELDAFVVKSVPTG